MMQPVIDYLIAYTRPGGGKLATYGSVQYQIPVIPPLTEINFDLHPYFGSYASIAFIHRFGPNINPNTLWYEISHTGAQLQLGLITTAVMAADHLTWLEITKNNPVRSKLINVTAVNQYFESIESFLLFHNEEDWALAKQIVREYGRAVA